MLRTMAMQITRENYPLAFALMPVGFVLEPLPEVLDNYIVINEIGVRGNLNGTDRTITYTTTKYTEAEFKRTYGYDIGEADHQYLFEVYHL